MAALVQTAPALNCFKIELILDSIAGSLLVDLLISGNLMMSQEQGGNCWNKTCSICWTIEPIGAGTQELNLEIMLMMAIPLRNWT